MSCVKTVREEQNHEHQPFSKLRRHWRMHDKRTTRHIDHWSLIFCYAGVWLICVISHTEACTFPISPGEAQLAAPCNHKLSVRVCLYTALKIKISTLSHNGCIPSASMHTPMQNAPFKRLK